MDRKSITRYIDLIFCVIFLPLVITLIPVDRWLIKYTWFAISLIVFLYLLYFIYRRIKVPRMFMQGQYGRLTLWLVIIISCTLLISHFPFPDNMGQEFTPREMMRLKHLRWQTVWLLFLVVSGFSLTIELTFELFDQIIFRKDLEAEKNRAELSLYNTDQPAFSVQLPEYPLRPHRQQIRPDGTGFREIHQSAAIYVFAHHERSD